MSTRCNGGKALRIKTKKTDETQANQHRTDETGEPAIRNRPRTKIEQLFLSLVALFLREKGKSYDIIIVKHSEQLKRLGHIKILYARLFHTHTQRPCSIVHKCTCDRAAKKKMRRRRRRTEATLANRNAKQIKISFFSIALPSFHSWSAHFFWHHCHCFGPRCRRRRTKK